MSNISLYYIILINKQHIKIVGTRNFDFAEYTKGVCSMDLNALKYNDKGLIPAIVQDSDTKEVLMMAWMSRESLVQTLQTGKATYWSRSREKLWVKGETSGNYQTIVRIFYDCDADTLLLVVKQKGVACHTGSKTCFYRELTTEGEEMQ